MEYGLIGEHLGHSFSPEIHAELGNKNYVLHEVPRDALESFMKEADFKGINVTIPYKEAVMPYLDEIAPEALEIGAVNTVVKGEDGRLRGYNTDFYGLRRGTGMEHGIALTLDGGVQPFAHTLRLIPRIVHIGVGCRRGADPDHLMRAVMDSLSRLEISPRAVRAVASIDLKREEPAVLRLAEQLGGETRFYTSDELNAADGRFPESGFVHSVTGTDNVCQRAAARSAGAEGICLLPKTVLYGTTVSIYQEKWRAEF